MHFDVMDGHFVPNLTFGIPVLRAVAARTSLPIDVHLMVEEPDRLLDAYLVRRARPGCRCTGKPPATSIGCWHRIRGAGAKAGVVAQPGDAGRAAGRLSAQDLDFVLLMSVNPGFAGQDFLPHVLEKARRLREMIEQRKLRVAIEMDGGIGHGNIRQVTAAGVDICVAGSAVFGHDDPAAAMRRLRQATLDNP